MCGIAGKISFTNQPIQRAELARLNAALAHRGPDDQDIFLSRNRSVGLAHRRLSIIDLSPAGHQPMSYQDRYWIVFNGEIYDFPEKRRALTAAGYTFRSHTDTEVILALYAKYREKCLDHLRGMFAFAIYDSHEQTVFLARDRVGKKPLKYYHDSSTFIFASELKAILTQPEVHPAPDLEAIDLYLSLQYVPAPLTGFQEIRKLEPGHSLTIDIRSRKVEKRRYWQLDYTKKLNCSPGEWQERIIAKLDESTRLRMLADVPLGAFLSGGIDSSAVVALMQKHASQPVKTFSIGFEEAQFDERSYARLLATHLGCDHTEFVVKPANVEIIPELAHTLEEPFADHGALPTYFLSQLTRQAVTVALNGDGGDENFAGYDRYTAVALANLYDTYPYISHPLRQLITALVSWVPGRADRLQRFLHSLPRPKAQRYLTFVQYLSDDLKHSLYTPAMQAYLGRRLAEHYIEQTMNAAPAPDTLDQALWVDFTTYLPGALLPKVDLTTMAASLEARSPFLDHEFLELTASIPSRYKLHGLTNKKYILKQALTGLVPAAILERRKQGFGIPLERWFTTELAVYSRSLLLEPQTRIHEIFRPTALAELWQEHQAHGHHGRQLWALLMLEVWWREFFD